MSETKGIVVDVPNHYRILKMPVFRQTKGVIFDVVPMELIPGIHAIDRVIHVSHAVSPGTVGSVERPWYMHTHQSDNLVVLHGERYVELYSMKSGAMENFHVGPDYVKRDGDLLVEGSCMLVWPPHVFHRVISGSQGSASINLASHLPGIDMKTNFNIFDLDRETGKYTVLRAGHEDQM